MRSVVGGFALLCASALAIAAAAPALDRSGPVRVGQHFAELAPQAAWKRFNAGPIESCDYVEGGLLPTGVSMMLQDGRVARFDVADETTVGPFGIFVGDSEATARAQLPAGHRVEPHHYGNGDGKETYLTWHDPHSGFAVRYEIGEGSVRAMYWGTWDAVQLVEGCA
ncbi:hypothetical protein ACDH70_20925 [Xanthomonas axonopodis pv. poinsettiicola]|uniref:hypothetical protein n=1 Tax=Xanthomonas TaxID=338 RepID=UPI001E452A03|nr:hypothetical protein [Xanthomonas codiaei]MCC8538129.1 hypothetical protein [Xanthomonas codiaei]